MDYFIQHKNGTISLKQTIEKELTYTEYMYTGEMKDNNKHGKGIEKIYITLLDEKQYGNILEYDYNGEFYNDLKHGYGKYNQCGDIYEGYFVNNMLCGKGRMIYNNSKVIYDGEWKDNKLHGSVKVINPTAQHYLEAKFRNGIRYGEDIEILKTFDGEILEKGYYKNGKLEGNGLKWYSEFDVYEVNFKNGNPNGYGVFSYSDNSIYSGEWVDGRPNGKGVYIDSQGNILMDGIFTGSIAMTDFIGTVYTNDKTTIDKVDGINNYMYIEYTNGCKLSGFVDKNLSFNGYTEWRLNDIIVTGMYKNNKWIGEVRIFTIEIDEYQLPKINFLTNINVNDT